MADFSAQFCEPSVPPRELFLFLPLADPINYGAVIMPLTMIGDVVPPTVDPTPDPPGPVDKDDPIVIVVEDVVSALTTVVVMAFWPGKYDVIYDGENFSEGYSNSSVVFNPALPAAPTTGTFTLRRNLGWPEPLPPGEKLKIKVRAVDRSGQST